MCTRTHTIITMTMPDRPAEKEREREGKKRKEREANRETMTNKQRTDNERKRNKRQTDRPDQRDQAEHILHKNDDATGKTMKLLKQYSQFTSAGKYHYPTTPKMPALQVFAHHRGAFGYKPDRVNPKCGWKLLRKNDKQYYESVGIHEVLHP